MGGGLASMCISNFERFILGLARSDRTRTSNINFHLRENGPIAIERSMEQSLVVLALGSLTLE